MPDSAAGTQFTVLGPVDVVDVDRVRDFYSYPDDAHPDGPHRCWVRGNMIASVDGGATVAGTSGGLGGPGDRALFGRMREAADVILVGAATVRTENYSGVQLTAAARQTRRARGQSEVPPIAVLTRSGDLDRDAKLFHRTEAPPLILTTTRAAARARERFAGLAEIVDASGPEPGTVDPATALDALARRGLLRVLAEGGPAVLGLFTAADLLDELCVTVAPVLVGGEAPRIVTGPGGVRTPLRRSHVLTDDDGYLYCRYIRSR
jgi:riboflavin biosynthesis pyrimidine reductase